MYYFGLIVVILTTVVLFAPVHARSERAHGSRRVYAGRRRRGGRRSPSRPPDHEPLLQCSATCSDCGPPNPDSGRSSACNC